MRFSPPVFRPAPASVLGVQRPHHLRQIRNGFGHFHGQKTVQLLHLLEQGRGAICPVPGPISSVAQFFLGFADGPLRPVDGHLQQRRGFLKIRSRAVNNSCCACLELLAPDAPLVFPNPPLVVFQPERVRVISLEISSSAGRAWLVNTINAARNSSIASTDVILACVAI